MENEVKPESKGYYAKECLDNPFFRFVLENYRKTFQSALSCLNPADTTNFTILQSQKILLTDILNTFLMAAEEENADPSAENKGIL